MDGLNHRPAQWVDFTHWVDWSVLIYSSLRRSEITALRLRPVLLWESAACGEESEFIRITGKS